MKTKICSKCKKELNVDHFFKRHNKNSLMPWCKSCFDDYQKQRYKDRKKKAVELLGGKCQICGYDKNYAALDFHHVDPKDKEYSWQKLKIKSWKKILKELKKCVCLCGNCHREIHYPGCTFDKYQSNDNNRLNLKPIQSTGKCQHCNKDVFGTIYCSTKCANYSRRKVKRPKKQTLKKLIDTSNYCEIGRKYSVSDNAVRKWAKNYGLI
jgi:hypothetical protein